MIIQFSKSKKLLDKQFNANIIISKPSTIKSIKFNYNDYYTIWGYWNITLHTNYAQN